MRGYKIERKIPGTFAPRSKSIIVLLAMRINNALGNNVRAIRAGGH